MLWLCSKLMNIFAYNRQTCDCYESIHISYSFSKLGERERGERGEREREERERERESIIK